MPNFGNACNGCSGEDCVCCEVYLEAKADQNAEHQEPCECGECEECLGSSFYNQDDGDNMSDVEADANTLASAGMGTDEDYGDFYGDE